MRTGLIALAGMDILLLIFARAQGGHWVVNTQVAFVTSALVMGASMLSYARMVHVRLESGAIPDWDDRDVIDRMDDPHDLYGESDREDVSPVPEELSAAEIKAAITEEKKRLKAQHRSPMALLRDSRPFMSLYRLAAYGLLLFGFFYLQGNKLFAPLPYLIGLGVPIVVIVAVLMQQGKRA